MSTNDYNRRSRLNYITDNDRIILNIYLNMYNQTIRDIQMLYRQIDLSYENLADLRNIINVITGVTDLLNEGPREHERENTAQSQEQPGTTRNNGSFMANILRYLENSDMLNRETIPAITPSYYNVFPERLARAGEQLFDNNINRTHRNRQSDDRYTNANTNRNTNTHATNTRDRNITHRWFNLRNNLASFYDNVPVYPSRQQIRNGTRRRVFGQVTDPLNTTCPITLERFQNENVVTQISGCGHLFTPISLNSWFRNNVRCPLCRYDIRNYVPSRDTFENNLSESKEDDTDESKERDDQDETDNQSGERNQDENAENNNTETSTQSSSTLHTADTESSAENNSGGNPFDEEAIDHLSSITENLITNLLNRSGQGDLLNGLTYNIPYYDASANEIIFEGFIQNNYRI